MIRSESPPVDAQRSAIMRAVKSRNTRPEIALRKSLFARGFRYRLNVGHLPGSPDLVFPKFRAVIFVHGCFWHGHDCPRGARIPATNQAYWIAKIDRNKARDRRNIKALRKMGWRVLVSWECRQKELPKESARCARWLKRRSTAAGTAT